MFTHVPHRIVVAPSGFKESLSAVEVAEAISAGLRRVMPGIRIDQFPVPDGGEGTVEILAQRPEVRQYVAHVSGPVGQSVRAQWVMMAPTAQEQTAVIEMASAAGLSLVPREQRDPAATTTKGVGELMTAAMDEGATRIIVGCGDSGTTDGGAGALYALGVRFFDEQGEISEPTGADLRKITRLDTSNMDPRVQNTRVELACNMHNILCGPHGVARVFGPQKGASAAQIEQLSQALDHWAELLHQELGQKFNPDYDIAQGKGSGASGGLGAGLAAIGAQPRNRFDVLLESPSAAAEPGGIPGVNDIRDELDELIAGADLVITAEGAIDFQTPRGKVPAEIARRAQKTGVPVLALAGSLGDGAPNVHEVGIGAIASIMAVPMPLEQAVKDAHNLLAGAAERSLRMLILGSAMAGQIRGRMGLSA